MENFFSLSFPYLSNPKTAKLRRDKGFYHLALTGAILFGLFSPSLCAEVFHVSNDGNDSLGDGTAEMPFRTIQKGVDAAADGDVVLIKSGTYSGSGNHSVDLKGKEVWVRGAHSKSVVIDCGGNQAFVASTEETTNTIIEGLTITNGYAESSADWRGTGIVFVGAGSALTIRNCIFHGNETKANYVTTSTAVIFKGVDPRDLETGAQSTLIENCLFYENRIGGGGWTSVGGGTAKIIGKRGPAPAPNLPIVINCTFANNELYSSASSSGGFTGGILTVLRGVKAVKNVVAWGNTGAFHPIGGQTAFTLYAQDSVEYSISDGPVGDGTMENLSLDPEFTDPSNQDFGLSATSPAQDTGDPSMSVDRDGTRRDRGYNSFNESLVFGGTLTNSEIELAFEIRFETVEGAYYVIQFSSDMINWNDHPEIIPGDGTEMSRLFERGDAERRFYRVYRLP